MWKKLKSHLNNAMPFVLGSIIVTGLGFAYAWGLKKYNESKAGA